MRLIVMIYILIISSKTILGQSPNSNLQITHLTGDFYIFTKNEYGEKHIDKFGHFIIDHDLHNQGGDLPDGIAEAFELWATEQNLSFAKGDTDSSGKKF